MPELGFIHRWIPATNPSESRTLLVLHGTGGDENSFLPVASAVLEGAAVLSPRGKSLEEGYPRFFRRFDEGVFDYEDLKARADELADFVRQAAGKYAFDLSKVVAVGYSNGANIASATLIRNPEIIRDAVLFRAMHTVDAGKDLGGHRVLISNGRSDPITPMESVDRLVSELGKAGAQVDLRLDDGGHKFSRAEVEMAAGWLVVNVGD